MKFAADEKESTGRLSSVQSLQRGLIGLEMAIKNSRVRPNDLADALDINRSSAYRLLASLVSAGYLFQDHDNKAFYPAYHKIEKMMPASWEWMSLMDSILEKLSDITALRVSLGTIEFGDIVYARCYDAKKPQPGYEDGFHQGTHRPSHVTALGKAILAFKTEEVDVAGLIQRGLIRPSKQYPIYTEALTEHLRQIRNNRYAIDDQELTLGTRCIAAPIFDCKKNVISSLGVSGPASVITLQILPEMAQH
ncbi:MAG: IclR family transcriptional regulator, partial [Peptococcaceae bacterium]|nr:IclR family transcriptional regulator [Peptococcaceae bacterium]